MYSIDPVSADAWRTLLDWVLSRADAPFAVIDYPAPLPLSALWSREDLGAVFMCGLPYSLREPRPQLVAAPIPSPSRYGGKASYMTDLVVRADAPFTRIEDTFGRVAGYTVTDSQSGYFAFRHFLAPYQQAQQRPLYRSVIGDLLNARGVIDALAAGSIDIGPLDSYCHDLLRQNQPDFAAQVKVVASTEPTPIPAFVATAALDPGALERLRAVFIDAGSASDLAAVRERLLLDGFTVPAAATYAPLAARRAALNAAPELW